MKNAPLLNTARNEKDVENAYRAEILSERPDAKITSPYGSDGYARWGTVRALLEFKYDLALKGKAQQAGVLGQMLLYVKKFSAAGETLPNVLFVGDRNECFALSMQSVQQFLDLPIDWSVAPSQGHPELTRAIAGDQSISPFVFDVADLNFRDVLAKIETLAEGEVSQVRATLGNIGSMFIFWRDNIFVKGSGLTAVEQVDLFLKCLFRPDDITQHPANPNLLVSGGDKVPVNGHQYRSFIQHFVRGYRPSEIEAFYAAKDRLVEDDARRRQGAFFTPQIWVDEAHRMLEAEIGQGWRDECIVWDPACYDDQTQVLTHNGWRLFKDLEPTDLIYSLNPQTHLGEYVPFVSKIEIPFKGNLDHYTSTRLDLAVTPDHQMYVLPRLRTDRNPRPPYQQISADFRRFLERGNKACLPAAAPLDGGSALPYLDDELRLLGFYLGDGFLWKDGSGTCNAVGFHLKKARKIKFLRDLVQSLGLDATEYFEPSGYIKFRILSSAWVARLLQLQGALTKRVPDEFFSTTSHQCRCLLEGFWESDGCGSRYYSSNEGLAEDVERLCIHVGASTYLSYRDRDLTPPSGKTYKDYRGWELSVSYHKDTRKSLDYTSTSSMPYDGVVYCVTLVRNHVMLVRRNGKTVFCGNCGTGNLTRDYQFADLILSTAEKPDVDVIHEQGYNAGAQVFAYDFLNDDSSPFFESPNVIPPAVDRKLREAAKAGKRLVFFMNPPYGTAGVTETKKEGTSKVGLAATFVNAEMKKVKIGGASQQLYAQFMYRCAKLVSQYGFMRSTVATYSVPTFMCSGSYKGFRDFWYKHFQYKSGMLFQASHFADVSSRWGISFTLWSEGHQDSRVPLPLMLKDLRDFSVVQTVNKFFYNSDDQEASDWVREPTKGMRGLDAPQMSSGLILTERDTARGSLIPGSLYYMVLFGNNLRDANDGTYLLSSTSSRSHGYSVVRGESFRRSAALYVTRKLVLEDWVNQKDEYLRPLDTTPAYKQWNDDAIVYTLLHRHNNCTAMRNVKYKGKTYRIKNHFWHRTLKDSKALYDRAGCSDLYRDVKAEAEDAYLATILPTLDLSLEAQVCLAMYDKMILDTLPHRESFATVQPELHLTAHDAGLYQLKHLFRAHAPEDYKAFSALLKNLANKLRPGVYEHGFLRA